MDPQHREDAKCLLAAPPRVVNVGLELFAIDLAGQETRGIAAQVVHVQWSPPAGGNCRISPACSASCEVDRAP